MQVTEHWRRQSREAVESPLLEMYKIPKDAFLRNALWDGPARAGKFHQMTHWKFHQMTPFHPGIL